VAIALDLADRPGMVLVATVCGRSWHAREVPAPRRCGANASVAATERFVLVRVYGMAVAPVDVERGRDRRP
jgi:hypothetical protein